MDTRFDTANARRIQANIMAHDIYLKQQAAAAANVAAGLPSVQPVFHYQVPTPSGGTQLVSPFFFPYQPVGRRPGLNVFLPTDEVQMVFSRPVLNTAPKMVRIVFNFKTRGIIIQGTPCPGGGGWFSSWIKGIFSALAVLVAAALPAKMKKYAMIIVIIVVSYFTAGLMTAELLAIAPEIGSLIAGEIAGEVVGKVLTPANLIAAPLPQLNPKSYGDLQSQLAAMWAGLETDPTPGLAASYAAALEVSAQTRDHAPLLAVVQALNHLMVVVASGLSLAWMQEFDVFIHNNQISTEPRLAAVYAMNNTIGNTVHFTSPQYACGMVPGKRWSTDQWWNWSMTLGPGTIGALPTTPAVSVAADAAVYAALTRAQNAPDAPLQALIAAFDRVHAPAWVAPWLWAAMSQAGLLTAAKLKPIATIVTQAVHSEFQAALTTLATARAAARVAAAATAEDHALATRQAVTVAHAVQGMKGYDKYGPLLIGAAVAVKAWTAGAALLPIL